MSTNKGNNEVILQHIYSCLDDSVIKAGTDIYIKKKTKARLCILCLGNPGAGKSTLLNSLIGEAVFKSGYNLGTGMTSGMDLEEREDRVYIDTPGLADPKIREHSAKVIFDALKYDISYKIIFVITLQGGYVRPQDLATMSLVLEVIKDQIHTNEYGVVINKLVQRDQELAESEAPNIIRTYIKENDLPCTSQIAYLKEHSDSIEEDNAILHLTDEFYTFIEELPCIKIDSKKVKNIKWDKLESEIQKLTKVLDGIKAERKLTLELEEKIHSKAKVKVKTETIEQKKNDVGHTFKIKDNVILLKDIGDKNNRISVDTMGVVTEEEQDELMVRFGDDVNDVLVDKKDYIHIISKGDLKDKTAKMLTKRGISLRNLLDFYDKLGKTLFLDFDQAKHTTEDVVREAIIPDTITDTGGEAYAEKFGNNRAERMVSHHWKNTFHHLVCAIVADAMGDPLYNEFSESLSSGEDLKRILKSKNTDIVYWICAFAVNQHRSICKHEWFVGDGDKCKCKMEPFDNDHPACEINNFDEMFKHLVNCNVAMNKTPRHVVAIDEKCNVFKRTWVLSELVQADNHQSDIEQKFYAFSKDSMTQLLKDTVDIKKSETTDPEDKKRIVEKAEKFPGIDIFNSNINKKIKKIAQQNIDEVENVCILCIGNKGVGKTFIRESMMKHVEDCNFMELQGFANTQDRQEVARAMNGVLQTNQKCKIFFVITLEGGRVRQEDTETISLVNDSVSLGKKYTIIVNMASTRTINSLKANDNEEILLKSLLPAKMETGHIVCIEEKKYDDYKFSLSSEEQITRAPYIIINEAESIEEKTVEEILRNKEIELELLKEENQRLQDQIDGKNFLLEDGPGPQHGFKGKTQSGYGPEWCGISLEQIQEMKSHTDYNNDNYLMRNYVKDIVEPYTDGTGISYALLKNSQSPLKVEVLISHAWDESIKQFVEAIERSKEEGPFWVCAFSIHQNYDPVKGVTIHQQLGKDPEYGPFSTILKEADLMLVVLTDECDLYTKLWCVYEIYFAIGRQVKVRLAPHISAIDLEQGNTHKDICVNQAKNRVNSKEARCGAPGTPMNEDEIAIRNVINTLGNGFKSVDQAVERLRLIHLVSYPMDAIKYNKATARDKIRDAIEHILPCFAQEYELKYFDDFLSDKLLTHSGFERICRDKDGYFADHDYYITNGDVKHDVFQHWCLSILDMISI